MVFGAMVHALKVCTYYDCIYIPPWYVYRSIVVKRHHYFAARYDGKCYGTRITHGMNMSRTWHDRTSCAGAKAVRAALETMGVCPSQLCSTR